MKVNDVIVIGAGAAGLAAARQLSKAGLQVSVLEARDRIGGRIHTLREQGFEKPTELGAEFIHGDLPVTISLLKEYGIPYSPAKGRIWQKKSGELKREREIIPEHHDLLEKRLKALKKDITVKQFFDKNFKGKEFNAMKASVRGFVEGYESAELDKFSTFALRKDWLEAERWEQYRIQGGYTRLLSALADESNRNGCKIHLSAAVKKIAIKKDAAHITCRDGRTFSAAKVILATPISTLKHKKISFSPAIPKKINLAKKLGYGNVIKILLQFRYKFWENKALQKRLKDNLDKLFFLFSEAPVPTWWTQHPDSNALLTGWLSGPKAKKWKNHSDEKIFRQAMDSLAMIFETPVKELKENLAGWKVASWSNDEFTLGSYAYATVNAEKYIRELEKPVRDTLFFSGEIFSEGGGIVENALAAGFKTAEKVLLRSYLKK